MNREEINYSNARSEFNQSLKRVSEAIKQYESLNKEQRAYLGINESDYVRLTRTIQLALKYLPKRQLTSSQEKSLQNIFLKLIDAYRSMKNNKTNKGNISITEFPSSYVMSEELIEALRQVRYYDFLIRNMVGEEENSLKKILNIEPTGNIIKEQNEGPGILDDYRQGNWGVSRICLDGIQNHLPNDAKGTTCLLEFEVDGKWLDVIEAQQYKEKITRVRFSDDGVGFTPENLLYLHSTKSSERESVGQFGEGMKLASMASINLGLGIEFQSRNWKALAIGEDTKIVNTRDNDKVEEHKRLVYNIKTYDGEPIIGSRTIFNTPTKEFIDYALRLPERVLPLNPNYKPLFKTQYGDIVSTSNSGEIFVKGVYVQRINCLFSYNFDGADVNPDRNQVVNYNVEKAIYNIILNLNDINLMKKLIAMVVDYQKTVYYESFYGGPAEVQAANFLYRQFQQNQGVPNLWREAFKQALEQKGAVNPDGTVKEAVLKTDYKAPSQVRENLSKSLVISMPNYWTLALQEAGVKTDRESLPEYINELVATSLSLDYGQEVWNNERMILDAAQNHLPSDSGGKRIFIRFQTQNGVWHDYSEFDKYENSDIKKIKISDDGTGYDFMSLGLLASVKNHDVSSGKWGEGLKMLSTVALRNHQQLELRSRDWMAVPEIRDVTLNKGKENEKTVQQLVFNVTIKVNSASDVLSDGDSGLKDGCQEDIEKSSTTFVDPSKEIIDEFRNIKDKILLLARKQSIVKVGESEVLDLNSESIFVRNIKVPGKHGVKYGYHFKNFDIETRDRNALKEESIKARIKEILEQVREERFISAFLRDAVSYAKGELEGNYLEFNTGFSIENESYQADAWIKVFKQDYGEKAGIRFVSDMDMNSIHQAQHLDVKLVTLPDRIAFALINLKGRDGQTIASYKQELSSAIDNAIPIPDNDLTEYEKYIINHLYKYNELLSKNVSDNPIKKIKVFYYKESYRGPKAAGFAGNGNEININREILNGDLESLGHVFFHESDHAITGAHDADAMFRNFLSTLLSDISMSIIPIDETVLERLKDGRQVSPIPFGICAPIK